LVTLHYVIGILAFIGVFIRLSPGHITTLYGTLLVVTRVVTRVISIVIRVVIRTLYYASWYTFGSQ
jgi:UPF0716 family protein affecting phage T7 exclusion